MQDSITKVSTHSFSSNFTWLHRISYKQYLRLLTHLRSPFWLCLLVAIGARVWIIVHTHGVLAGDEAMAGIQAEHILGGERPIYYYNQPYMGSLEMYLLALTFFFAGPSVLTLRITMLLVSLGLVTLTWHFATALANEADLAEDAKRRFRLIATLLAALPPLYDAVLELRSLGGYIEVFVIMLWLLHSALRLTQRWRANASPRELLLRWVGLGFLLGLGFWVDPLVVYAVLAVALWLATFVLLRLRMPRDMQTDKFQATHIKSQVGQGLSRSEASPLPTHRSFLSSLNNRLHRNILEASTLPTRHTFLSPLNNRFHRNVLEASTLPTRRSFLSSLSLLYQTRKSELRRALLALGAIPGFFVGWIPALYWGVQHQWENVSYIFHTGGAVQQNRLQTIFQVQQIYTRCLVPRVIGGALPVEPGVTTLHPHVLTPALLINGSCILLGALVLCVSLFWRTDSYLQLRRLLGLPLLFLVSESLIYCMSSIAAISLVTGCGPEDATGRYVGPLVIVLPFFLAAVVTLLLWRGREGTRNEEQSGQGEQSLSFAPLVSKAREQQKEKTLSPALRTKRAFLRPMWQKVQTGLLFLLLIVYFVSQTIAYIRSDSNYMLQGPGCAIAPANSEPIISYLLAEHIRYAWATGWVGDPITFKTNGAVLLSEPEPKSRLPLTSRAILHSDRPSILLLVKHSDLHPPILRTLDKQHVTYRTARFFSQPETDLLIITPLNRNISPYDPIYQNELSELFDHC